MVYGGFPVRWDGQLGKTQRIAPAGCKESFALGQVFPRSNRATTDHRSSGATEPRITKQSQFLITPFDPAIYRRFVGGGSEPRKGELKVA